MVVVVSMKKKKKVPVTLVHLNIWPLVGGAVLGEGALLEEECAGRGL